MCILKALHFIYLFILYFCSLIKIKNIRVSRTKTIQKSMLINAKKILKYNNKLKANNNINKKPNSLPYFFINSN